MNESAKPKSLRFPEKAVATFVRKSDNQRIWIYARRHESVEAAVQRVTSRHGVSPKEAQLKGKV